MEIATKARRHKGSPNNYERHFCLALILSQPAEGRGQGKKEARKSGRAEKDESRRGEPTCSPNPVQCLPVNNSFGAVDIVKGYREDDAATPQTVYPNEDGIIAVEIKELERVEIHFPVSPVNNISPLLIRVGDSQNFAPFSAPAGGILTWAFRLVLHVFPGIQLPREAASFRWH